MALGAFRSIGFLGDIARNYIFLILRKRIGRIESDTAYSDLHALYLLARGGFGAGAIVEIGAYKGKSAVVMALGSQRAGREKVVSIDPHYDSTKDIFMENMKRMGVGDHVVQVVATSEEARRTFNGKIRLLFIDGNHAYEFVMKDISLWRDLVIDGGVIVFHDINWGTVAQAIDELIRPSADYIIEGTTGCSLLVSKGSSRNKELFGEIKLFNTLKNIVRPWRLLKR